MSPLDLERFRPFHRADNEYYLRRGAKGCVTDSSQKLRMGDLKFT